MAVWVQCKSSCPIHSASIDRTNLRRFCRKFAHRWIDFRAAAQCDIFRPNSESSSCPSSDHSWSWRELSVRQEVSRREFLHSSLAAFAGSLVLSDRAFSCSNYLFQDAERSTAPNVTIIRATTRTLDINGKAPEAMGLLRPNGTQGMSCVTDQLFNVRLDNELSVPTAIHWHGLHPPNNEDGVPGVTARRYRVGRAGYLQRFVSSSACRGYVQHQPVCCQWPEPWDVRPA